MRGQEAWSGGLGVVVVGSGEGGPSPELGGFLTQVAAHLSGVDPAEVVVIDDAGYDPATGLLETGGWLLEAPDVVEWVRSREGWSDDRPVPVVVVGSGEGMHAPGLGGFLSEVSAVLETVVVLGRPQAPPGHSGTGHSGRVLLRRWCAARVLSAAASGGP